MFGQGMNETYFISQLPHSMERAIMLAKIQEKIQEKGKSKLVYGKADNKAAGSFGKQDQRATNSSSHLGKERHMRDYCRANNLCFYCKEPYDATHVAQCSKRPQAQVNNSQ